MPLLTIEIPKKSLRQIRTRARQEGFKEPAAWVKLLMERQLELTESPKMAPPKIIAEMQKTNRYRKTFLRGLKRSLEYADKTAQ